MYNKVQLIGRMGGDPEVRRLESGSVVARITVATHDNYKDKAGNWQEQTEWHSVIAWNQLAERIEKTMGKGKLVFVEGKITSREWTTKEGEKRTTVEIKADSVRLLEKSDKGGDGAYSNRPPMPDESYTSGSTPPPVPPVAAEGDGSDMPSDDLPF